MIRNALVPTAWFAAGLLVAWLYAAALLALAERLFT